MFTFDLQRFATTLTATSGTLAAGEYVLESDITLTAKLEIKNSSVTIDLNGHKIDGSNLTTETFMISRDNSNLTINDSVGTGSIISGTSAIRLASGDNKKFTLNGGTISERTAGASNNVSLIWAAKNSDSVVINGGAIEITKRPAFDSNASYTINGGKITGDYSQYISEGTDYVILDGVLYAGTTYTENSDENIKNAKELYKDNAVTVDGATQYFTDANSADKAALEASAVYAIGDNRYTTREKAFAAAQAGDTIKLLGNATYGGIYFPKIDKDITFDLNGWTLSNDDNTNFAYVQKGATFNLIDSSSGKTGKFNVTENDNASNHYGVIFISPGGNFNANGVNIDVKKEGTSNVSFFWVPTDGAEAEEVANSGRIYKATNTGKITLTDVTATTNNQFLFYMGTDADNPYATGYEVEVTGGEYTSTYTDENGAVFALAGTKTTFNGAKVTTESAVGVVLDDARYDTPSTDAEKAAAASTPTATFKDCEFTVNGTAKGEGTPTAMIAVASCNVAQIKGDTYKLGKTSVDVGGLQVYNSNGGFIVDSGTFVNESTAENAGTMFKFFATYDTYKEDFGYMNSGTPSAVVKGGDFTNAGTLTNTAKTSSDTSAAGQLKVTGGSYGYSEQVSDYVPAGSVAEKSSSSTFTIGEDPNNEWKQDETTKTTYHYVLGKTSTLITATGVTAADSVNLRTGVHKRLSKV